MGLFQESDITQDLIGKELKHLYAIVNLINLIDQSDNKEEIDLYIKSIEEQHYILDNDSCNIREAIRNGEGSFKKIQKKCIDFGLV